MGRWRRCMQLAMHETEPKKMTRLKCPSPFSGITRAWLARFTCTSLADVDVGVLQMIFGMPSVGKHGVSCQIVWFCNRMGGQSPSQKESPCRWAMTFAAKRKLSMHADVGYQTRPTADPSILKLRVRANQMVMPLSRCLELHRP